MKSFLGETSEINKKFVQFKEELVRPRLEYIPVKKECLCETISIESENGLTKLRELFSETITFGISKKKPKYKKKNSRYSVNYNLHQNDRCSRINCTRNDTNKVKQGVTLTWFKRGTLCVQVVYDCGHTINNDTVLSEFYNNNDNNNGSNAKERTHDSEVVINVDRCRRGSTKG